MSTSNPFDLTGKVAVITGASRGIGAAIAHAYAAAGAKVVLGSRKQESLNAVAEEIRAAGGEALPLAAHTGSTEAVESFVAAGEEAFGGIDILVNNAATNPHFGPLLTAEESHWDKTFDVNVKGYFRLARACIPLMHARGGGSIINVASVAGLSPQMGMGVYCVTKAGVLMLTQVLAAEVASEGVRVNAVAPGFIKTRFSAAIWENPQLYETVVKMIPQHRMADAQELAGIMLYLASDASSFTTGSVFTVDGGQMVGSGIL